MLFGIQWTTEYWNYWPTDAVEIFLLCKKLTTDYSMAYFTLEINFEIYVN